MTKYPVRPSHRPNLQPEALERILRTHFEGAEGSGPERSARWGAIDRLTCRADGRDLSVEVTMKRDVPAEVASETIARYNRFLEEASGYSAKERAKRLRKSAGTPGTGA